MGKVHSVGQIYLAMAGMSALAEKSHPWNGPDFRKPRFCERLFFEQVWHAGVLRLSGKICLRARIFSDLKDKGTMVAG